MRSLVTWVLLVLTMCVVAACSSGTTNPTVAPVNQPVATPEASPAVEATQSSSLPSGAIQVASRLTFYDSYADW